MLEENATSRPNTATSKPRPVGTMLLVVLTLLTALNTVALFLIYDRLSPITESAAELDEGNAEAPAAEDFPAEEPPAPQPGEVPTKTSSSPNDA